MGDIRIQYTEQLVQANHPVFPDTLNRLATVSHNNDGTHNLTALASGSPSGNTFLRGDGQWAPIAANGVIGISPSVNHGIAAFSGNTGYAIRGATASDLANTYHFIAGGTSDVITGTLYPSITSYVVGMRITTYLAATNATSTPTLNLNSLGAVTIVKPDAGGATVSLSPGDFNISGPVDFEYNGTNFVLHNNSILTSSATALQNQLYTSFTTAGSSTTYILTTSPAIVAYTVGLRLFITLHITPSSYPTMNISGLGALNIKYYTIDSIKIPLIPAVVPSNLGLDCYYDGTDLVVINPLFSYPPGTQQAIFGYGTTGSAVNMTNLVSNTGIVATDTTGVGTARYALSGAGYGLDKAIFGYGNTGTVSSLTNLISNTGVVATDTTGVGTARDWTASASYGIDKAIFGYGENGANSAITNLVSNTGVVATDTTGVGTARGQLAAAGYGVDKAIFGYGTTGSAVNMTNLVSNTGVVATDTTGVGTARFDLAAAGYGSDKAIFGYGNTGAVASMTNLVSNTGVVATDTTGVGTARYSLDACAYGSDKAIFGYGYTGSYVNMTNLVSNTGVVATDTTGVGTARSALACSGFSLT